MSEELIQRALHDGGRPYGEFEYLNIGSTNLSALRDAKLIPARDYSGFEARKPDALILDRRGRRPRVVAVIEFKANLKKDDGIWQAATVAAAVGAKFCVSTDGDRSHWFLPDELGAFRPIRDAVGANLVLPFVAPENARRKKEADAAESMVKALDERLDGDQITAPHTLNPSGLARSVWQDIFTAGNTPTPAQALSTFVEIFMFKYLSDLGVLTTDNDGTDISFEAVLSKPSEQCLRYYKRNVRGFIKGKFPESAVDHTTIMNGFTLNPENTDHNHVFKKILRKFKDYESAKDGGRLVHIDREFKSRLFEDFLKGSVGQRSLGQFFTPRRLMAGIVDMANVEALPSGARVGDPACGVGGFPLEAAARRATQLKRPEFRLETEEVEERGKKISRPVIVSDLRYNGYDKGSDKTDENLTIILAKANFVIYQSDILPQHPEASVAMAAAFNTIFRAYTDTSLGSLSEIEEGSYALILSNPPYVTSGAANLKEAAKRSGLRYSAGGTGVEGLFLEKIVRELAPGGRAFVILPDGIFLRSGDAKLRAWVAEECFVDGIISLPVKTFFSVKKKTYVLCLTRKSTVAEVQEHPVFSYLVQSIGETLDTNRFPTSDSDMPEMARLFRAYVAVKDRLASDPDAAKHFQSPKLKLLPSGDLTASLSWAVDRFWTKEEKVALDLHEEAATLTEEEFYDAIKTLRDNIETLLASQ